MDSLDLMLLVLCGVYVVVIVGVAIRELFFGKKERLCNVEKIYEESCAKGAETS